MNARAFLRWAAVNVLLGSWTTTTPPRPTTTSITPGGWAPKTTSAPPYFTFIPWDYDNCLGIDYFGT